MSEEHRKKKAAIPKKHVIIKPINVPVVMLKNFSPVLPKGKDRQRLMSSGQILNVRVNRDMTPSEVCNKIKKRF